MWLIPITLGRVFGNDDIQTIAIAALIMIARDYPEAVYAFLEGNSKADPRLQTWYARERRILRGRALPRLVALLRAAEAEDAEICASPTIAGVPPEHMTTEEFLIEQDRVRDASDADEVARLLSGYQEALRDDPKSRWLPYLCGHASGDLDYRLAEEADRKRKGSAT